MFNILKQQQQGLLKLLFFGTRQLDTILKLAFQESHWTALQEKTEVVVCPKLAELVVCWSLMAEYPLQLLVISGFLSKQEYFGI